MTDPRATCHCQTCAPAEWWLPRLGTPRTDTLAAMPAAARQAHDRVTWRHYSTLLHLGIPARDLTHNGAYTFGVVTIRGREMIVTENRRVRAWLDGPVLAAMPGPDAGRGTSE